MIIKITKSFKYSFVFTALFFVGCSNNKTGVKNSLNELKLKGSVKYLEETSYFTNDEFQLGNPHTRKTYLFDKNGYLLEKLEYGDYGYLRNKETYQYNDSYNIVAISRFGEDGSKLSDIKYKYDELGRKLHEFIYENDTLKIIYKFKYYPMNNKIVCQQLNQKMKIIATVYSESYDSVGNMTNRIGYGEDGKGLVFEKSVYDTKRNLIKYTVLDPQGIKEFDVEYKYDEKGNEREEIQYLPNGGLQCRDVYDYLFLGDQLNWTKKIKKREMMGATFGNPNIQEITLRKIEYFQN